MRTGLIAKKLGMTRVFANDGNHVPVTVLEVDHVRSLPFGPREKDGYTAVQLGTGKAKVKNVTPTDARPFRQGEARAEEKARRVPRLRPTRFSKSAPRSRRRISLSGQFVDVVGTTKGKGFAGVIKRHHFGGLRATHGVSVSHRSPGSTGQRQDPGKVFRGKKMPGHLGDVRVTTQNLRVVTTDAERGLIMSTVRCPVPRAATCWSRMRRSGRRRRMCRFRPRCAPPQGAA